MSHKETTPFIQVSEMEHMVESCGWCVGMADWKRTVYGETRKLTQYLCDGCKRVADTRLGYAGKP